MLYLNSVPPRLLCKTKSENDVSTPYEIEQDLVFTLQPTKEIKTIMWITFFATITFRCVFGSSGDLSSSSSRAYHLQSTELFASELSLEILIQNSFPPLPRVANW